VADHRLP
jgi:eukaryotic-like serine/threonine-protein kinase